MRTFYDLQQEVLRYFDVADEVTGSDIDMAKDSLNQANALRCGEHGWKFLRSPVYTLSVVSGTQEYILPHSNFGKLEYLWSPSQKRYMIMRPIRATLDEETSLNEQTNASSRYFDMVGWSMVKAQPPTASTLIVTTTGAEPNNPELYIEGEDANGNVISATLGKDETSVDQFARVTYYAKTGDFNTTLTLATSGGTQLVVLPSTEYARQYPKVKFYAIPAANESMQYRFFRAARKMTRNFDTPDIPYPLSNILVYDALLDLATFNELDSESVNIWREKQRQWLDNLYTEKLDGDIVAGEPRYVSTQEE